MKKILIFIFSIITFIFADAQSTNFQWAKQMGQMSGGSGDGVSMSIAIDTFGNVYTTGYLGGTVDFNPGPGVANLTSGMFISKLDPFGNFVWAKGIAGAEGYSIFLDQVGNIYATGSFQGTTDFDPDAGVYNLTSFGGKDVFILKLDASADFLWAKQMGGALDDNGKYIAVDIFSNVCISGVYNDTADFDPSGGVFNMISNGGGWTGDLFVSKLDSSGNFEWAKSIGGIFDDDVTGIALDIIGNIYTTGRFEDTVDFDPGIGVYNLMSVFTSGGAYVSKLDFAGNFVWAKQLGGSGTIGFSIVLDLYGNVYTTGEIGSAGGDFDPGAGVFNLNPLLGGAYVSKLDNSGSFIFAKCSAGTYCVSEFDIAVDTSMNIYLTGSFIDTTDFDPGIGVFNLITSGVYSDAFISKYNSIGDFVWAKQISGPNEDIGVSIAVDHSQNVYTTGHFHDTVDFNPGAGTFSMAVAFPGGAGSIYVHKMGGANTVWPGDADHTNIVDNYDLLPIGLFYGLIGTPRATTSNTWQEYNSTDWSVVQSNDADIKHADCNGDGVIDNNDTLAVNLNFALTHAFAPTNSELRLSAPDLHFVTSSSSYLSGSIVDVQVWLGNSTTPVSNLYGIAFDINYDASLVQPSSESLTYPTSWLGTPGTDAITIAKIDAVGNTAYGAETRIDQVNASGFGKIADFKFQLKSSIPANTVMYFSTSGYQANNASGASVLFSTPLDSIIINSTASVTEFDNITQISIYPNPSNGSFNIFTSEQIKNGYIEIYNSLGKLIVSQKIISQQNAIDIKNQANGLYFVKVISDGRFVGIKKIVKE